MLICKPKHKTYEVKFRFVWNHDENVFFGRVTANQMASQKAVDGGLASLKRCSIGVENERSQTLKNKTHWRWSANDKIRLLPQEADFAPHRNKTKQTRSAPEAKQTPQAAKPSGL